MAVSSLIYSLTQHLFRINVGDTGSIPESGRSPGEGNGNPLQYSCLENPMDRGAWWATVHGVVKSQTRLKWHVNKDSSECVQLPNEHSEVDVSNQCLLLFPSHFPFSPQNQGKISTHGAVGWGLPILWWWERGMGGAMDAGTGFCQLLCHQAQLPCERTTSFVYYLEDFFKNCLITQP